MDNGRQEMRTILYSEIVKCKFYFGDKKVEIKIILKFILVLWHTIMIAMYAKRIVFDIREETIDNISAIKQL